MDLDISGNNGKYNIKIYDKKAYIRLINYTNLEDLINEAVLFASCNHASNIYLSTDLKLDYNVLYYLDLYELEYTRFTPNKEYKLKPLLMENRCDYTKMYNIDMNNISNKFSIEEANTLDLIRNKKNIGFFEFKKEFVGIYYYDNNEIIDIAINTNKRGLKLGLGFMKKLINKLDGDVIIKVSSDNIIMLDMIKNLGFKFKNNIETCYILK